MARWSPSPHSFASESALLKACDRIVAVLQDAGVLLDGLECLLYLDPIAL